MIHESAERKQAGTVLPVVSASVTDRSESAVNTLKSLTNQQLAELAATENNNLAYHLAKCAMQTQYYLSQVMYREQAIAELLK